MLPLKLILKGLYSYQQEQVIDFTRLTEGKLFGIFGAVGSGKSSILEAISFALYGETERLNRRDDRGYNMMNLKCGDLLIQFNFLAGVPETEYKCIVTCKRNKTIFKTVSSPERKAYRKVNSEWIPVEVSELPSIIGLSYDNFRRTIIIPQGRFSEFLQLGDKDRTEMLKEIFHLERFEYSSQVSSLEKKNSEKINILEGKLQQIGEVNESQLTEYKDNLERLNVYSKELSGILEERIEEENRQSNLKEIFQKLRSLKTDLKSLKEKSSYYVELEKKIKDYEYCILHFRPLLDQKKEIQSKINSTEQNLQKLEDLLKIRQEALLKEEAAFHDVQLNYSTKENLKAKKEELQKIISIISLQKEITAFEERVVNGNKTLQTVQEAINQMQNEREDLKLKIQEKKHLIPDVNTLKEVSAWFTIQKGFKDNLIKFRNSINQLEQGISRLNNPTLRELATQLAPIFINDEKKLPPHEFLALIKLKKEELSQDLESLNMDIEHLSLQSRLEEYAAGLKQDEPCPLCGSRHHPDILTPGGVGLKQKELKEKKTTINELLHKLEELSKEEQGKLFKIESIEDQIKKELKNLQIEEERYTLHQYHFKWMEFDKGNADDAELRFKKAVTLSEEVSKMEELAEKTFKDLAKHQENKEKFTYAINQFNIKLSNNLTELKTLKSQIKVLEFSNYISLSPSIIEKEIDKSDEEYNLIISRYEKLSSSINSTKQEIARLDGQLKETSKNKKELAELCEKNSESLKKSLSQSLFEYLHQVEVVLSEVMNVEKEKQRVNDHNNRIILLNKQVEDLEKETQGKEYNENQHKDLIEMITHQKDLIAEANKEIGKIGNQIKQMERDREERSKVLKELEQLQLRRDDLNVLKQLFKGSGFVNYVSSVFLRNLCNAANDRFYKLTRQKLRLELREDNNFQVRDFLNNGQVRSVKTLSGGQIFQASLSLALALAESVSQQNKAGQNFFFLDEGFGSQDKESLNIVFETLKALRKENRIVGIISHVSELQQEIDVYLNIVNDEESGSTVRGSWEITGN